MDISSTSVDKSGYPGYTTKMSAIMGARYFVFITSDEIAVNHFHVNLLVEKTTYCQNDQIAKDEGGYLNYTEYLFSKNYIKLIKNKNSQLRNVY